MGISSEATMAVYAQRTIRNKLLNQLNLPSALTLSRIAVTAEEGGQGKGQRRQSKLFFAHLSESKFDNCAINGNRTSFRAALVFYNR